MQSNKPKDGFSTSFGILTALVGSAVGLGNLWRFPYLMGTNGGAAFMFIYLGFTFVLCLPMLVAELTIGRRSHSNAFNAFNILSHEKSWGKVG